MRKRNWQAMAFSQTMGGLHRLSNKIHHKNWTVSGSVFIIDHHYLPRRTSTSYSRVSRIMSSGRSEFTELLNLLAADNRHRSVHEDLSPYLSRVSKNGMSTPSNFHRRAKSDTVCGNYDIPPTGPEFPFTFKQMIHTLYDTQTWADKVKDLIEESKTQFKPLPEELKSQRSSSRGSPGEGGSQIRTIKKRCTGRTHVPDPVFVPKPTYVNHNARSSSVDLHIESRKSDAGTPSPTKRRPSQSRATRPVLTLNTGARRPRHQSLTQLDVRPSLWDRLTTLSDSEDSEFDALATPIDTKPGPISALPPLKIPKRSSTTYTIPNQPSTLMGHRQTGRARSSSFGGSTCLLISPVFRPFEPDGE